MKEYPLTQPELIGLGGMSLAATAFFSLASWCFTTWFDIKKDLAIEKDIEPLTRGYYEGLVASFGWGTVLLVGLGVVFLLLNGLALLNIIRNTKH